MVKIGFGVFALRFRALGSLLLRFRLPGLVFLFFLIGSPTATGSDEIPPPDESCSPAHRQELIRRMQTRRPFPDLARLFSDLEADDSRTRWLAARNLGDSGLLEGVPYLIKRLNDRNPEVRRRAREALVRLGRPPSPTFVALFRAGIEQLSGTEPLFARAVLEEVQGRTRSARQRYRQLFAKEPVRFWAAYWAYDTPDLARVIDAPLTQRARDLAEALEGHVRHPGPAYPQTLLRESYALSVLAEAISRRVGKETLVLVGAGKTVQAGSLKKSALGILAPVRELNGFAKRVELEVQERVKGFQLSDFDPDRKLIAEYAARRAGAAQSLGACMSGESEKALVRALHRDPNGRVRAAAAVALSSACSAKSNTELRQAYEKETLAAVKHAIIGAMGCRADTRTRDLLYRLARVGEYRAAAFSAIGRAGAAQDIAFLRQAAEKLISPGPVPTDAEAVLSGVARGLELAAESKSGDAAAALRREAEILRRRALDGE